jgi:hypothetical protein
VIDIDAIPMEQMELVLCRCIDCRHALPPSNGCRARGCSRMPVDGDRDDTAWHWCAEFAATLAQDRDGGAAAKDGTTSPQGRDTGERGLRGGKRWGIGTSNDICRW